MSSPLTQDSRESLYSAINDIKSLKDQNKSLMTENIELKKELTNKDKALERAKTANSVLSYASEEWRTRCEVMEKGLAANTFQLQVSCLRSSIYFTIISCWILTAALNIKIKILFFLFSGAQHQTARAEAGVDQQAGGGEPSPRGASGKNFPPQNGNTKTSGYNQSPHRDPAAAVWQRNQAQQN